MAKNISIFAKSELKVTYDLSKNYTFALVARNMQEKTLCCHATLRYPIRVTVHSFTSGTMN